MKLVREMTYVELLDAKMLNSPVDTVYKRVVKEGDLSGYKEYAECGIYIENIRLDSNSDNTVSAKVFLTDGTTFERKGMSLDDPFFKDMKKSRQ